MPPAQQGVVLEPPGELLAGLASLARRPRLTRDAVRRTRRRRCPLGQGLPRSFRIG
jgi:hypothetical protein